MARRTKPWNKCCYCGRYISFADYDTHKAERQMITPDSEYTSEQWVSYHFSCFARKIRPIEYDND